MMQPPDDRDADDFVERLYRSEAKRLLGYVLVFEPSRTRAEDVVHETFIALRRRLDKGPLKGEPVPYLHTTARNKWHRLYRNDRRRDECHIAVCVPEADACTDPAESVDDRGDDVRAALAQLPPRQREVVWLHYVTGLKLEEVALTLTISKSTAKTHLHRARKTLRENLRNDHEHG